MRHLMMIIVVAFMLNPFFLHSQEAEAEKTKVISEDISDEKPDTTDSGENDWDNFVPDDKALDFSFATRHFKVWEDSKSSYKAPFIDIQFGLIEQNYEKRGYDGNFGQTGIANVVLGYEKHRPLSNSLNVFNYSTEYFALANANSDYFNPDINSGEIDTELWTLGLGGTNGYGYKIADNFKVILYEGAGMNWNHLDFSENGFSTGVDSISNVPKVFGKQIRFGDEYKSGVKFQVFETISLGAEYQSNLVFPRHMFWYWSAGKIVEAIAVEILDTFVGKIADNSPYLVPIFNLALKTGLRYGLYQLKTDNMNWPVNTAPPFMYESFKATVSVNF